MVQVESNICEFKKCELGYVLTFTDENGMKRRVCMIHWNLFCDHKINLRDTTLYKPRKRCRP
jgi:hypothetical protein